MKAEVSKVQKAEMACHSDETREKASEQPEQPSSTSHTDVRSATDGSVPKSKSRGRNRHKLGAKKWVHVPPGLFHTQLHNHNDLLLWCLLFSGWRVKLFKTERSPTTFPSGAVTEKQMQS